jgi:hypothetical protein
MSALLIGVPIGLFVKNARLGIAYCLGATLLFVPNAYSFSYFVFPVWAGFLSMSIIKRLVKITVKKRRDKSKRIVEANSTRDLKIQS